MTDDNNNPQYEKPLIDFPTISDVEEKPVYDDGFAPVAKNYNTIYNQAPNYNSPSSNTVGQTTSTYQYTEHYYSQNNDNYTSVNVPDYFPESAVVKEPKRKLRYFIAFLVLSILLIIDQLIAIILQINMNSIVPPILVDNIAVIITAILYLLVIFRVIKGRHIWLGIVSIIVYFFGFGLEVFGMVYYSVSSHRKNKQYKYITDRINIPFMVLRSIIMVICHPYAFAYSPD